jgi:hypothetical protein
VAKIRNSRKKKVEAEELKKKRIDVEEEQEEEQEPWVKEEKRTRCEVEQMKEGSPDMHRARSVSNF